MDASAEISQQIERRLICPVNVFEDDGGGRSIPADRCSKPREHLMPGSSAGEERLELAAEVGRHVEQRSKRSRCAQRFARAPQERSSLTLARGECFDERGLSDAGLAGDPDDLTLHAGSRRGPPSQGPPSQGPPSQGPPSQGPPSQGPPSQGPPSQGPPSQGPPSQGPPSQGPPSQGPPSQGPPSQGPPSQGPPSQGPPSQGPPSQGPPSQGPPSQGPVRQARDLLHQLAQHRLGEAVETLGERTNDDGPADHVLAVVLVEPGFLGQDRQPVDRDARA